MAAVGRTINAICASAILPTPFDAVATIPPTQAALVRRVPRFNLWLWYRVDDERVDFIMVTPTPPVIE
ncbi:MAG: hypothetical protein KIT84_24380 [Labilithrix sp.]|nr:hypothetical protein [Labilithrix sp.]MCW5814186.1 hypothetical protein [Labilithrix sp.]